MDQVLDMERVEVLVVQVLAGQFGWPVKNVHSSRRLHVECMHSSSFASTLFKGGEVRLPKCIRSLYRCLFIGIGP
jgi:hypothetical protein